MAHSKNPGTRAGVAGVGSAYQAFAVNTLNLSQLDRKTQEVRHPHDFHGGDSE